MSLEQVAAEWKNIWPNIVANAWLDNELRTRLLDDPLSVLHEYKLTFLEGVEPKIVAVEGSGTEVQATLRLPLNWQSATPKAADAQSQAVKRIAWTPDEVTRLMGIKVEQAQDVASPTMYIPLPPKPPDTTEPLPVNGPPPGTPSSC